MLKKNKLIFSQFYQEHEFAINYIDIGARGDILSPWNLFDEKKLNVFGFEPDKEECARLRVAHPNRTYFPTALWGCPGVKKLFLNQWQSTSSMYRSNEVTNKDYVPKHWSGRLLERELNIECNTLDNVVGDVAPDFIKIDTQGAEYEILQGATTTLKEHSPMVLAETWCTEVYDGAPMTHDVMRFMNDIGYELLDLNLAAAWKYDNINSIEVFSKARSIGFDLLFVKRLSLLEKVDYIQAVNLAGLLELFGFRDLAILFLEKNKNINYENANQIINILLSNSRSDSSLIGKIERKIHRFFKRDACKWAPMH